MSVLDEIRTKQELHEPSKRGRTPAFLPVCANPGCASGWLHVWRSRTAPMIEGGWSCSPGCTRARIADLIHREHKGHYQAATIHRHRVPLGLVLLAEGWITHEQLKKALDEQRAGAAGHIGAWLMEHCGLEERRVTQALSIQWNCPIFALDQEHTIPAISLTPRLFMDTFRFFPLRLSSAGILYIAFEDRIDHSVTLALERMTGLRVEAGLVNGSEFRHTHNSLLEARSPVTRMIEAASIDAIVNALTRLVEKEKPLDARLVRLHDFYWLRLWKELEQSPRALSSTPDRIEDVICYLTVFQ